MAYSYNVNPTPTTGATAYGQVPGQIGIPPSQYDQVASAYPGQAAQTGLLSSNIGSELAGSLSPQTIAALQQHAAQFGVKSGMPGSQFQGNQGLAQLGLDVGTTQRQGGSDLLAAEKGIGSMQTPQDLAASIASANANLGAAPDPQKAAEAQMGAWMAKFNASAGGGGGYRLNGAAPSGGGAGPSGGTGAYSPNYNMPYNPQWQAANDTNAAAQAQDTAWQSSPWAPTYGVGGAATSPANNQFGDPTGNAWAQQQDPFAYAQDTGNYDYGTGG